MAPKMDEEQDYRVYVEDGWTELTDEPLIITIPAHSADEAREMVAERMDGIIKIEVER